MSAEIPLKTDYELTEHELLISDLADMPNPYGSTQELLCLLIKEFRTQISAIVINSSCVSHIDALEDVGFDIVHEEANFITAEYEIDSNQTTLTQY